MNRKYVISGMIGLVVAAAFLWLLIRVFSSGYSPGVQTYIVARDNTWYPIDLRGRERNMVGFANDLIQEIGSIEGFRVQVFDVGRNGLIDGLNTGRFDAILSTMEPNIVNRKRYAFSQPFYLIGPVLVVPENSSITSLSDLKGKILGIESSALPSFRIPEAPDVVVIPYDTISKALERLDNNTIDAVFMDVLRAYVFTEGFYRGRLKVATLPLTDRGLRLVALNDLNSLLLISQFDDGLQKLKDSGRYGELIEQWGLIATERELEVEMNQQQSKNADPVSKFNF